MAFQQNHRIHIATVIAVIMHMIGLIGILYYDKSFFIAATPINLLLMFLLLLYTQEKINLPFIIFAAICFVAGMAAEITGVATGKLFGDYEYGNVLGPKYFNVPLIIGINWFIIIYCCGITIRMFLDKMIRRVPDEVKPRQGIKTISLVVDGATLAVFLDWLMEPVAVKLGYWRWLGNGSIPFYNYISWLIVSILLLLVFNKAGFPKRNKFAVHLLLIQAMFFLLLRTFL